MSSPLDFLLSLPPSTLNRLYSKSSCCIAIYRLLSLAAQQYITRLLLIRESIPLQLLQSWLLTLPYLEGANAEVAGIKKKAALGRHTQTLSLLRKLNIFVENNGSIRLNEEYQDRLLDAIRLVEDISSFGRRFSVDSTDSSLPNHIQLDTYCRVSWEKILHYMVGSENVGIPSAFVLNILKDAGYMGAVNGESRITNAGFQFLLQDIHSQIWQVLLRLAENAMKYGYQVHDVVEFCFFIGSLDCYAAYDCAHLSAMQLSLLENFSDIGLVYYNHTKTKKSKWFIPTKSSSLLNVNRSLGGAGGLFAKNEDSFIIIETNYRLYAYTNSPLQISILGLFVNLKARFENLVVGVLTRESVRRALSNGITSAQIISFLATHAHPQMKAKVPVLPPTIVDQLKLWEIERNRLDVTESHLYTGFASDEEFNKAEKYAEELGVLLWAGKDPQRRMLAISSNGHEAMRSYVKQLISQRDGE